MLLLWKDAYVLDEIEAWFILLLGGNTQKKEFQHLKFKTIY